MWGNMYKCEIAKAYISFKDDLRASALVILDIADMKFWDWLLHFTKQKSRRLLKQIAEHIQPTSMWHPNLHNTSSSNFRFQIYNSVKLIRLERNICIGED